MQSERTLLAANPGPGRTRRTALEAPERRLANSPWLLGSLLLHLALMLALVPWPDRRQPGPQELPAPTFDIVFEGGQPERAETEPPPGLETPRATETPVPPVDVAAPPAPPNVPLPPAPSPAAPAQTPSAEAPPAPLAQVPPPLPAPSAPATPPAAAPLGPAPATPPQSLTVPPPPAPAPGIATLPPPPPPPPLSPRNPAEAPPPEQAPAEPLRETNETLALLPPSPAAPPPATPGPQQPATPTFPPGALFLSEDLLLGRPTPPPGRSQARGLDLRVDPRMAEGRTSADPTVRVSGAQVGADWRAAFRRWLDQNMRYPPRAAQLGESGTVRVRVVAEPDGRVRSVTLTGPSVSPSLNVGTTFPFVDAQLPAFPPPTNPDGVTIDLTVNYYLVRR